LLVIASAAKQSSGRRSLDCFVASLLAMTEANFLVIASVAKQSSGLCRLWIASSLRSSQ